MVTCCLLEIISSQDQFNYVLVSFYLGFVQAVRLMPDQNCIKKSERYNGRNKAFQDGTLLVKRMISRKPSNLYLKGSSETSRKITPFNFKTYELHKPSHIKDLDISFMEWLIGFTEGDGSFIVSKGKVSFDITQSLDDIQVLHKIKDKQGFGNILTRPEPLRNVGFFYVTGKENFIRLAHIFNGNLCSIYKRDQFAKWQEVLNAQYQVNIGLMPSTMEPSLQTSWLSGFIDAEGSLEFRLRDCRTSKQGKAPMITQTIGQKHKEIQSRIRSLFVRGDKNIRHDPSWNGYQLHLSSFRTLDSPINLANNYLSQHNLKTEKIRRYYKWRDFQKLINERKHLTKEGLLIQAKQSKVKGLKIQSKYEPRESTS